MILRDGSDIDDQVVYDVLDRLRGLSARGRQNAVKSARGVEAPRIILESHGLTRKGVMAEHVRIIVTCALTRHGVMRDPRKGG